MGFIKSKVQSEVMKIKETKEKSIKYKTPKILAVDMKPKDIDI